METRRQLELAVLDFGLPGEMKIGYNEKIIGYEGKSKEEDCG
jgi:hypothetical protein